MDFYGHGVFSDATADYPSLTHYTQQKDKKFYLDQAKKLKDTFNSKYPDYVYRRRPNNTRRKRKSDTDPASPTDAGDDDASYEETSPVEGEYSLEQAGGYYQRSHNSSSSSGGYEHDSVVAQQTTSTYPYPPGYPGHLSHPSRAQGLPGGIDTSLSVPSIGGIRMHGMNDPTTSHHGYSYNPYQPHASSPVSPSQSQSVQGAWDSSRVSGRPDQGRNSWSTLPALDTSMSRQRSNAEMSAMSARSDVFSPQVPNRPWSSSASSTASSSSGGASGPRHLTSPFPTLASSFQPAFSPDQRGAEILPSPTSLSGGASDFLSATSRGMPSTGRHGTQEHVAFSQSQTLPPPNPTAYPTNTQWNSQYSRSGTDFDPRQPPPISTSPLSHSTNNTSPPPAASGTTPYINQWDRKYDGR